MCYSKGCVFIGGSPESVTCDPSSRLRLSRCFILYLTVLLQQIMYVMTSKKCSIVCVCLCACACMKLCMRLHEIVHACMKCAEVCKISKYQIYFFDRLSNMYFCIADRGE